MASDYRGRTPYEEHRDADGRVRPAYERLLAELEGVDLEELYQLVVQRLADDGASFGEQPFVIDIIPRLLSAAEWDPLARGLEQRTRALNAFLTDAYGERRIVEAGIVAAATIDGAEGYEPELAGCLRQSRRRRRSSALISCVIPTACSWCSRTTSGPRRASRT